VLFKIESERTGRRGDPKRKEKGKEHTAAVYLGDEDAPMRTLKAAGTRAERKNWERGEGLKERRTVPKNLLIK